MSSTRGFSICATFRCRSSISRHRRDAGSPRYTNEIVQKWTAAIAQSDGFVFVTPEYNYGPPAVLKNAIDWVYPEWHRKAACFRELRRCGRRAQRAAARETAIEIQLAPIRSSVHIPVSTLMAHFQGGDVNAGLADWNSCQGDDRRPAVVDRSLEDGARPRVLTSHGSSCRAIFGGSQ